MRTNSSPPIYIQIERMLTSGVEPNYTSLFGPQAQAKIAALTLLTRQKLLDIHHAVIPSRDMHDARQDLANYVKILFHVKAADALGVFYDIAVKYLQLGATGMWANVRSRSLLLMAALTANDRRVLFFVHERPEALQLIEQLTDANRPEFATPAKKLLSAYRVFQQSPRVHDTAPDPPPYMLLYRQYERELTEDDAIGVSSWLTARDRIEQVVMSGDFPGMLQWITEGSPAALRETLRFARSLLSPNQYIDLLERALYHDGMTGERRKHIVLELGSLDRKASVPDGEVMLNRILARVAINADENSLDVATSAVQALVSVNANKFLLEIVEEAPCIPVAQMAIEAIRELRHLHQLKDIVEKRPELRPALQTAQRYIAELQELVSAASESLNDEITMLYLRQLQERHAVQELRDLARRGNRTGELALSVLKEIDPPSAVDYYGGKR